MTPDEYSLPSEEQLIDRITAGDPITAELLLDALDHASAKELFRQMQERCPADMMLPAETVHHLVGADLCFLQCEAVIHTLKEWQHQARYFGAEHAIQAMDGLFRGMYPTRGPGQPEILDRDYVKGIFLQVYPRIKRFQKAVIQFRPEASVHNLTIRTKDLIDLCQLLKKVRELQALALLRKSEPPELATCAEQFEERLASFNADRDVLDPAFVDCKVEWAQGSAADHADAYIAELFSTQLHPKQTAISRETVRDMRNRHRIMVPGRKKRKK
jgi:hypothetical protein